MILAFFRKSKFRNAPRPDHAPTSRALVISGLAVLSIAAIGLTAMALSSGQSEREQRAAATPPVFGEPLEQPTPEPENTAPPAQVVEVPQRVLAVGQTPGQLFRAPTPACGAGDGLVQYSFDDGQSWQTASFTDVPGAAVRHIDASDPEVIRVTFLDQNCEVQGARSYTNGVGWEPDPTPLLEWTLQGDSASLVTNTGQVTVPCPVVSVSGAGNSGIVLCEDAHALITNDSGATWSDPVLFDAAYAVASSNDSAFVVAAGGNDCVGVTVATLSVDGPGEPGACAPIEAAPAQVVMATGNGVSYVWAGDDILRSPDGGISWS